MFWDEDAGSLRLTPTHFDDLDFRGDAFLARRFLEQEANRACWKIYNQRLYLLWQEDSKTDDTRIHYYVTTEGSLLLIASYAYGKDWLTDEDAQGAVVDGLEDVDMALETLHIGESKR